mgnify:CR=1 FL=1
MENISIYATLSDEQIIEKIRNDDKLALEFLINKYMDLVNAKVSKYFIIGAERDDIVQEGLIGLYKAIKSYKLDKQNSFKSFANLCIERQLISAIKSSTRQKHIPLNSYLSLNLSAYNNDFENNSSSEIIDVFDNNVVEDPLETITKREYFSDVENVIEDSLSAFEKKVLDRYIQGDSYIKIAEQLDTQVKSVDNAIQRIRKKTLKNLNDIN